MCPFCIKDHILFRHHKFIPRIIICAGTICLCIPAEKSFRVFRHRPVFRDSRHLYFGTTRIASGIKQCQRIRCPVIRIISKCVTALICPLRIQRKILRENLIKVERLRSCFIRCPADKPVMCPLRIFRLLRHMVCFKQFCRNLCCILPGHKRNCDRLCSPLCIKCQIGCRHFCIIKRKFRTLFTSRSCIPSCKFRHIFRK